MFEFLVILLLTILAVSTPLGYRLYLWLGGWMLWVVYYGFMALLYVLVIALFGGAVWIVMRLFGGP